MMRRRLREVLAIMFDRLQSLERLTLTEMHHAEVDGLGETGEIQCQARKHAAWCVFVHSTCRVRSALDISDGKL